MDAKFLLRLDDACPTMDMAKWSRLEKMFDALNIKPIVAVVPDNKDLKLNVGDFDGLFWDKVRRWQNKGWTVAMHGYQHLMHFTDSKLILPYYKRSEFAGLIYEEQAKKIKEAWEIFLSQGISPIVWIAPAHCFDLITLKAIKNETSIEIISDGIAFQPYYENDFYWLPQQLWDLKEKKTGIWTVCLHPNMMSNSDIDFFENKIKSQFLSKIIEMKDVNFTKRKKNFKDKIFSIYFWKRRVFFVYLNVIKSLLTKVNVILLFK